eukprot:SAG31_NODE_46148_length_255_cov_1.653846_1_plen_52_part_10
MKGSTVDAMSDAIEGAASMLYTVSESYKEESTWEKQSMRLPGIVRHRRCAWL